MKRINLIFISALLLLGAISAQAQFNDRYLVMLKNKNALNSFDKQVQALGGEITYSHKIGIAIVSGLTVDTAAELGSSKNVKEMVLDASVNLEPAMTEAVSAGLDGSEVESAGDPTAAYFYPRQWNMRAIDADIAWAGGRLGSSDVTVAILDTGIDYTYPDLDGRVDLDRSISFLPDDDLLVDLIFPGRDYITDLHYHGTHVASTVVSNSDVIAGVTTETTLIGVKVCSVYGGCPFGAIIAGVLHAADNGADVANMSLGGAFPKDHNGRYVGFINKVFNYANSLGMTVVVSAGNDGANLDHIGNYYKSYCSTPNTICVSATGPSSADDIRLGPWYDIDALAYYSNYGRSAINVAAPGGNSGGYVYAACSQTSLVIPVCGTGTYIVGLGGTSMAAPHVSGLASLLVEDYGKNPGAIREALQDSADDLGQSGTDPAYGKGRINVANAVLQ